MFRVQHSFSETPARSDDDAVGRLVSARDPRVSALVSQVGSMDGCGVMQTPDLRELTFSQGTLRTRGEIGYPAPFAIFRGMTGQPVWEKLMPYAPIEDIHRCAECAKLFIIAENEKLFDNEHHAIAACNRATGVKKLVTVRFSNFDPPAAGKG